MGTRACRAPRRPGRASSPRGRRPRRRRRRPSPRRTGARPARPPCRGPGGSSSRRGSPRPPRPGRAPRWAAPRGAAGRRAAGRRGRRTGHGHGTHATRMPRRAGAPAPSPPEPHRGGSRSRDATVRENGGVTDTGRGARLTSDEVARVLHRAAELEALDDATGPVVAYDAAAVEEAAREVGLSPAAVRQAVAELRVGVLPTPPAVGRRGRSRHAGGVRPPRDRPAPRRPTARRRAGDGRPLHAHADVRAASPRRRPLAVPPPGRPDRRPAPPPRLRRRDQARGAHHGRRGRDAGRRPHAGAGRGRAGDDAQQRGRRRCGRGHGRHGRDRPRRRVAGEAGLVIAAVPAGAMVGAGGIRMAAGRWQRRRDDLADVIGHLLDRL